MVCDGKCGANPEKTKTTRRNAHIKNGQIP